MESFVENTLAAQQGSVIFATEKDRKPNCFWISFVLTLPFLQKVSVQIINLDMTQTKAFVEED